MKYKDYVQSMLETLLFNSIEDVNIQMLTFLLIQMLNNLV